MLIYFCLSSRPDSHIMQQIVRAIVISHMREGPSYWHLMLSVCVWACGGKELRFRERFVLRKLQNIWDLETIYYNLYFFYRHYGSQPDNNNQLWWKNGFSWNLFWDISIFLFLFLLCVFIEFPGSLLKSVGVIIYSVVVLCVSLSTWASLHERCVTAFVRDVFSLQMRLLIVLKVQLCVGGSLLPRSLCSDVISVGQRTASAY